MVESAPSDTDIRLLGPLEVHLAGAMVPLVSAADRAVVASLALRVGHPVALDVLAQDFWGDDPPAAWRKNVHVRVSRLRRRLGEAAGDRGRSLVLTEHPGYALTVLPAAVDAVRFGQLLVEGRRQLATSPAEAEQTLRAALDLWRGPPLPELADSAAGQAEIARLDGLADVVADLWTDAAMAVGRHDVVVARLEALLVDDPLREHRWGQLMRALYHSGRQSDALRAYQRVRALLVDELGLEPGPELQDLEAAILAHDLPSSPPPDPGEVETPSPAPDRLDSYPGFGGPPLAWAHRHAEVPFVGRAAVRAALLAAWARVRDELIGGAVLIRGADGMGKTRLAAEVALAAADEGAMVIRSRCIPGGGTGPIIAAMAPLGLPEVRGDISHGSAAAFEFALAAVPAIFEISKARPVLLVLDDAQWADPDLVRVLREIADVPIPLPPDLQRPIMAVIVYRDTSPVPHDLAGLTADLERMPIYLPLLLGPLDPEAAVELLAERVGLASAADAPPALRRLAAEIGGRPDYLVHLGDHLRARGGRDPDLAGGLVGVGLPEALVAIVNHRLAELAPSVLSLLMAASVVGERFALDVAARGAGLDDSVALDAVETALFAGIVGESEDEQGMYRFDSGVDRLAIAARLSSARRSRIQDRLGGRPPAASTHHGASPLRAG